jgi:hypothetical protein
MSATSIPVARLLQLAVPVAWQEAVELARSAHEAAATAGVPLVLEACVISTDGTVHIIPPPAGVQGHPLTLTDLLRLLLQGQDAPAELRALVDGGHAVSVGAPDEAGAAGRDLSWFASPRPELEIARLATRGIEAAAVHDAEAAIHRLRADVTDAPPLPPPTPRQGIDVRTLLRPLGLAAVVVLVLGGAALVVKQAMAPAPVTTEGGDAAPAAPPSLLDSAVDSLNRFFAPSGGTAPSPATPGAAETAAGAPRVGKRPSSPSTNPSGVSSAPASVAAPTGGGTAASGAAGEVPVTMERLEVTASLPRIYTQQDVEVQPPAFLHPQMPSEPSPDSRASDSYIEVTVDEQGMVMQVRLRSSDASVHERMLVSAAKAWQFRPALKDGQPVPYVLQVPVTR